MSGELTKNFLSKVDLSKAHQDFGVEATRQSFAFSFMGGPGWQTPGMGMPKSQEPPMDPGPTNDPGMDLS